MEYINNININLNIIYKSIMNEVKLCIGCEHCRQKCKNIIHTKLSDKFCYIHAILFEDHQKNEKLIETNMKNV